MSKLCFVYADGTETSIDLNGKTVERDEEGFLIVGNGVFLYKPFDKSTRVFVDPREDFRGATGN